jgi:hypothetical protein
VEQTSIPPVSDMHSPLNGSEWGAGRKRDRERDKEREREKEREKEKERENSATFVV